MEFGLNEFLSEQRKGLAQMIARQRKAGVEAARQAARDSAARMKALNGRVRDLARSGVRLTSVSQGAAQSLIELQSDIVSSALTDAAAQIERMAYTESVRDLARMQGNVLQATRQRIVEDLARAVKILKDAAGDARKVVGRAEPAKRAAPRQDAKPARRKPKARTKSATRAKRKVARTPRRTRRTKG
jgi:hypothetical protein